MNFCYANTSILFADDAASAQQHYSEYLGQLFRNVYMAADGEEAWELYKSKQPDIVLLDIEMPMADGLTLARKIRERDRKTRIIIATAHADEKRLLQAVELGLTRFLPKPFGRQALKNALAKAVGELDLTPDIKLGHGFRWDCRQQKLFREDEEVRLTGRETALFTLLTSSPGTVFSFYTIEMDLWPGAHDETDIAPRLKTLVKRLRKKLPEGCIENIYGEGYRVMLLADDDAS